MDVRMGLVRVRQSGILPWHSSRDRVNELSRHWLLNLRHRKLLLSWLNLCLCSGICPSINVPTSFAILLFPLLFLYLLLFLPSLFLFDLLIELHPQPTSLILSVVLLSCVLVLPEPVKEVFTSRFLRLMCILTLSWLATTAAHS